MDKRQVLIDDIKRKLDEWNAEIDVLEAKTKEVVTESRAELDEKLEALKQKRDALKDKLSEVPTIAEDVWDDFRRNVDHVWEAATDAFATFKSHFRRVDTAPKSPDNVTPQSSTGTTEAPVPPAENHPAD